ncbi:potassium transporter Kup [Chondromyces crocatus]|uniref:Probable potassium transport system protein Kup n=1 Tax=Chondromyces crocatus TaxID=52 RepID=A0A0K1ENN4_CHOCO|nr:potassium transporter Kup [Chondromyces crocatus]AKT42252.1 potassium transporter Kup [Chondromyces crocatus]
MTASTTEGDHGKARMGTLMLAALGVVYGDIGTSPLYAVKECFSPQSLHRVPVTPENILGVLSLVFWSLMMVVTVKYLSFITRADNEGAGGILALLALVPTREGPEGRTPSAKRRLFFLIVLFGAALLYGDGVVTPAISVLSAMEGLEVATMKLKPAVVPLTCGIILALFLVQKRGTAGVGRIFGPITLLWFVVIAALGLKEIVRNPGVLLAISPDHAVTFFLENKGHGFLILGSIVLCITGGEALYADMSHFGRPPIVRTWLAIVWPALLLNYFGQGARLLAEPAAAQNPFYALVPSWALYPTVIVATAAAVVASQALISGAYSLTQQAVQLGYFPRVTIVHTSRTEHGQIYIPEINAAMLVVCLVLVLGFQSSSGLAAAYGIAVTGTMTVTTLVYYVVVREAWGWSIWKAAPLAALFLAFDIPFFVANWAKFLHGGWVPVALSLVVFVVMTTWKTGRAHLAEAFRNALLPLATFLDDVKQTAPHRVRGTAVFMASNPDGTPPALLHHFKHNQVLHEQVVLLSIQVANVPEVSDERRVYVVDLGQGFFQVTAHYGFLQTPNAPSVLSMCNAYGLTIEPRRTSYYLGRETLLIDGHSGMSRWRKVLFAFISRNARPATAYFGLPPNRVVELGMQIDL